MSGRGRTGSAAAGGAAIDASKTAAQLGAAAVAGTLTAYNFYRPLDDASLLYYAQSASVLRMVAGPTVSAAIPGATSPYIAV